MTRLRVLFSKLTGLFRKARLEQQLDEDVRAHLEMLTEDNLRRGMGPEEARYAALRQFGNVSTMKEECRESWSVRIIEELIQDLRYGLRQLRRNPSFTTVAVLTLALGIGANTAIFSVIDAVMFKTLRVGQPGQLVILKWTAIKRPKTSTYSSSGPCPHSEGSSSGCSFSYSGFEQLRSTKDVLSGVLATAGNHRLTAIANGIASNVFADLVSGSFFYTLRVPVAVGRPIASEDDSVAALPVVVISYAYWMGKFGGKSSVIGKSLVLNGVPFTIVGVAAQRFSGLQPGLPTDLWVPLSKTPSLYPQWGEKFISPSSRVWWLWIVGRLKPGVNREQAQTALSVTFAQTATSGSEPAFKPRDNPGIHLADASTGLGLLEFFFAKPLFLLMAGVGLVLLIACANIANLMLARAKGRQREIAMRMGLGAGRWRLVRQLLTETLLLAGMGGVVGLLLAIWGSEVLASLISTGWFGPLSLTVGLDYRVIAFTAGVSSLAGLLFGLVPALHGTRLDLNQVLKAGTGWYLVERHRRRRGILRNAFTVWQLALVVPLLVGTGLFIRTISALESVDPGFNSKNLLLFSIAPGLSGYKGNHLLSLYDELLQRLNALPGVTSATLANSALLAGNRTTRDLWIEGRPSRTSREVDVLRVGPEFLRTMGIPLLAGRSISRRDFMTSQHVALINRAMARLFFPNDNPLGKRIGWTKENAAEFQIVGIIGDTKYDDLRKATEPTIYLPQTSGFSVFELRTSVGPKALIPAVRKAVGQVDSKLPIDNVSTQSGLIEKSLFRQHLLAILCSLFGGLALILACIGLYGVVSYGVAQRTHEIGIRMALGAQKRDVLRMVVRQGLKLALIGVAIGIGGAFGLTRFLSSLLYGVKPTDPLTFIAVSLILIAVALLACYIPARRASKVDPMVALRYE
jgi:predicted permease